MAIGLLVLGAALLVLAVRVEGRGTALDRRRGTIRALRQLGTVVAADGDETTREVADALVEVLHLRSCWYEATAVGSALPVLLSDGSLSSLIQHRVAGGIVLPDVLAIDAPDGGRYLLVGDPTVGTTPEERIVAVTIVAASSHAAKHRR